MQIPIALVADYYEHGIEHAPPRDPSGCMQRRERYYTAPANPFVLARSKLGKGDADAAVRRWIELREAEFLAGRPADETQLQDLMRLLPETSLSSLTLMEIGRGFNFLEGDELAACWYRGGLAQAEREYQDTQPGDPSAQPLLHALDQLKALWRLKDYAAMEKRFALAQRLNSDLSPEARRAGYLHAEMLYYEGRYAEAADAIDAVQCQHEQAGDLGSLESSDINEMLWVQGLFAFYAGRYHNSIPHFRSIIDTKQGNQMDALLLLALALTRTNQLADARNMHETIKGLALESPFVPVISAEIAAREATMAVDEHIRDDSGRR